MTIQAMQKTPPAIPGTYVRMLFDYLEGQGCGAEAVLGESAPAVDAGGLSYSARHWQMLLERAARHLDDPALGLRVGATISPAHLGALGYVLLASSGVPAALERYVRYQRLVHDVSPVGYRLDNKMLVLEWSAESRGVGLLVNQCGMAALVQFARDITGSDVAPLAVHFVEPQPADLAPYAALFRCPLVFAAAATRIDFAVSLLSLPLRQPDPALVAMLESQVQQRLAALPQKDDLAQLVRRHIASGLIKGEPFLDQIADELNMSGRTLRRKLEQGGNTFRMLLDETRLQMAQGYLRDKRLALPEVALLLGYSEQSAFNRAFLRWSGDTPSSWRRKMFIGLAITER
ncbi:AraC family transcriptional regulator [Janthinobacterium sp. HH01]|uniref:AraC family transcriptional regulator n=1 Tax=Janthinobacterium sp. HH01 TaxID=1198452 RepID=UPI000A060575|nr:AraC family transcriptional regulator [Janthinobacterium sp. HH01]